MTTPASYTAAMRTSHEALCIFHQPQYERCYGQSRTGRRCTYNGTFLRAGMLPMCNLHKHKRTTAGQCEALELCGKPCGRAAKGQSSMVCESHKNPKPCHLMDLPVEIRLMIYRYIFPQEVRPTTRHCRSSEVKAAVLKLNRQIYAEASSVLYGETIFIARVEMYVVRYLNTQVTVGPHGGVQRVKLPRHAGRVQRVCVEVPIALDHCAHAIALYAGDIIAYAYRETMCKLVSLLEIPSSGNSNKVLCDLIVRPRLAPCATFRQEEAITCLFLAIEPLKRLQVQSAVVEDPETPSRICRCTLHNWKDSEMSLADLDELCNKYREDWTHAMTQPYRSDQSLHKTAKKLALIRRRIETVLMVAETESGEPGMHMWLRPVFDDALTIWHYLRVATEHNDLSLLDQVQKAVSRRWLWAWRNHIMELQDFANTFDSMNDSQQVPTMRDLVLAPSATDSFDDYPSDWADLDSIGLSPALDDADIEVEEDLLRVHVRKDSEESVHLKTPTVIRKLALLRAGESTTV